MADASLLTMLDEIRGKTLQVLQGVSDAQARWAPRGLQNTILWHAGHSYIVVEWLSLTLMGRAPLAPEGWFSMFSWESRPAEVAADRWPALSVVVTELEEQHRRLRDVIGMLSDEQIARQSSSNSNRTVRSSIIHGLHDEACHTGEMLLLKKLLRVGFV